MPLTPGETFSRYEILGLVGKGGMGEVYRAKDTVLDREVAIKLIPEELGASRDRADRFRREARILASLNHPHIATLHGLEEHGGKQFLVMELVRGETLADRIARGPLSFEEAISLFVQIAEGLEAAHEKNIVHRDLKPANVKLTHDGTARILDFGLAKVLTRGREVSAETSDAPTLTKETTVGTVLGTAAYMSPEQATGGGVDARADIWSFGCCLYEALTGRRAFGGTAVSDVIGSILRDDPDWDALPAGTPERVRLLLARCLARDRRHRLQHIGDARIELSTRPAASGEGSTSRRSVTSRRRFASAFAAAALVGIGMIWWLTVSRPAPSATITRSILEFPTGTALDRARSSSVAISPDGRHIAFVAVRGGIWQLYLRSREELEARPIAGTVGASQPFFSPDGQWVGYFDGGAPFELMKVPITGGAPTPVRRLEAGDAPPRGASWGTDDRIVLSLGNSHGLVQTDSSGESREILTTPDPHRNERSHRLPDRLPGSDAVVFTYGTTEPLTWSDASIGLFSSRTGEVRVLLDGGSNPRYSASGHLLYARDGALMAVPFDVGELEVRGTPVTVVEDVYYSPLEGGAEFAVSREGTLVYAPGGSWGSSRRLVWVDRAGRVENLVDVPRPYQGGLLSRDGRSLAFSLDGANGSIWHHDLERGTSTLLTSGSSTNLSSWGPGDTQVTFHSTQSGSLAVYSQALDRRGAPELVVVDAFNPSWSADGHMLAFTRTKPGSNTDLWTSSFDPGGEPALVAGGPDDEDYPSVSPDGRWIVYQGNESGRREIYLLALPNAERKWQVSTNGGAFPRWARDGSEIFYRDGDDVMAVAFEASTPPKLGAPRALFTKPRVPFTFYDVASDGRFIFVEEVDPKPPPTKLVLVQNFFSELERLAPTGN